MICGGCCSQTRLAHHIRLRVDGGALGQSRAWLFTEGGSVLQKFAIDRGQRLHQKRLAHLALICLEQKFQFDLQMFSPSFEQDLNWFNCQILFHLLSPMISVMYLIELWRF